LRGPITCPGRKSPPTGGKQQPPAKEKVLPAKKYSVLPVDYPLPAKNKPSWAGTMAKRSCHKRTPPAKKLQLAGIKVTRAGGKLIAPGEKI